MDRVSQLTTAQKPIFTTETQERLNESFGRAIKPIADADNAARYMKFAVTLVHYGLELAESQNPELKAFAVGTKEVSSSLACSRVAKSTLLLGSFKFNSEVDNRGQISIFGKNIRVVSFLDVLALSFGLGGVAALQWILFLNKKGICPLNASWAARLEKLFPKAALTGNGIAVLQNGYRCYVIKGLQREYEKALKNDAAWRREVITAREKDIENAKSEFQIFMWGGLKYGSDGLLQVMMLLGVLPEKVSYMSNAALLAKVAFFTKMGFEVTRDAIGVKQVWMSTEPKDKHKK